VTLATLTLVDDGAARHHTPTFTAVVVDGATVVLDEQFENRSARRDAIVQLLLVNHDEVSEAEVEDILAPFGGANADEALSRVTALYAGYGVDVHLGEYQRDAGPAVLYTSFTDYGDGTTFIDHHPSRKARLKMLRQRAADLTEHLDGSFFDTADEETCRRYIEFALTPTRGRVWLTEAARHSDEEVYSGHTGED